MDKQCCGSQEHCTAPLSDACTPPTRHPGPRMPPPAGTHPVVLEILEVPQLMDTCCRSGNFDEALDLRAFVNKVGRW